MSERKRRWGRSFGKRNVAVSGEMSVEVGFVKHVSLHIKWNTWSQHLIESAVRIEVVHSWG
jgi:hypothetical protein